MLFNSIFQSKADFVSYLCQALSVEEQIETSSDNIETSSTKNKLTRLREIEQRLSSKENFFKNTSHSHLDAENAKKQLDQLESVPFRKHLVEEAFKTYLKQVEDRLRFIKVLKMNSSEFIELKEINMMWNLFVDSAIHENERNLFFENLNNLVIFNSGKILV